MSKAKFLLPFLTAWICIEAMASFEPTSFRYISGHEVTAKLAALFPEAAIIDKDDACFIKDANAASTGMALPTNGKGIYPEPGSAFLNWYSPCVSSLVEKDLVKSEITRNLQRHVGPLLEKVQRLSETASVGLPYHLPANAFSKAEMAELVQFLVERLLGPDEVIEEMGLIGSAKELRESLIQLIATDISTLGVDLKTVIKKLEIEILSRDEFLVY